MADERNCIGSRPTITLTRHRPADNDMTSSRWHCNGKEIQLITLVFFCGRFPVWGRRIQFSTSTFSRLLSFGVTHLHVLITIYLFQYFSPHGLTFSVSRFCYFLTYVCQTCSWFYFFIPDLLNPRYSHHPSQHYVLSSKFCPAFLGAQVPTSTLRALQCGAPERKKIAKQYMLNCILGEGFCKCCQPQTHWNDNVGEMCFIPINCSMVFVSSGGSTFRL